MRLFVQTFGCQMNESDSREMKEYFEGHGCAAAPGPESADVLLVNTCTVRQHAEDKAWSYLGRLEPWKRSDPRRVLIVAGCAAERMKGALRRRFPHIDLVVGARDIGRFAEIVDDFLGRERKGAGAFNWFRESEAAFGRGDLRNEGDPMVLGEADATAFVTVMRGCNYSCSYCIVPSVRGRETYKPFDLVLEEVRAKARRGLTDVLLLGQTVNSYRHPGPQGRADFADLVRAVDAVPDVREVRFMSPHPHYMSERLIAALAACGKVSPQIHLPAQSGSDAVLKRMKRNYTRAQYVDVARRLRAAVPRLELGTDFIVGFPGETDADFEGTLALVREVSFGLAYCFKYSPRQGTESCALEDDVEPRVKDARLSALLEQVESAKREKAGV